MAKWVEFKMRTPSGKSATHGAPAQVLEYLRQKYGLVSVYPYESIGAIMRKLRVGLK